MQSKDDKNEAYRKLNVFYEELKNLHAKKRQARQAQNDEEIARLDLEIERQDKVIEDFTPQAQKLARQYRDELLALERNNEKSRDQLIKQLQEAIGNAYPISDSDSTEFLRTAVFFVERLKDILDDEELYRKFTPQVLGSIISRVFQKYRRLGSLKNDPLAKKMGIADKVFEVKPDQIIHSLFRLASIESGAWDPDNRYAGISMAIYQGLGAGKTLGDFVATILAMESFGSGIFQRFVLTDNLIQSLKKDWPVRYLMAEASDKVNITQVKAVAKDNDKVEEGPLIFTGKDPDTGIGYMEGFQPNSPEKKITFRLLDKKAILRLTRNRNAGRNGPGQMVSRVNIRATDVDEIDTLLRTPDEIISSGGIYSKLVRTNPRKAEAYWREAVFAQSLCDDLWELYQQFGRIMITNAWSNEMRAWNPEDRFQNRARIFADSPRTP
ncbi:MAG: hypothetical protein EOM14_07310 [Clostridia bacterium]|nr:hypothetical protein [Clostridia bacterium]